MAGPTHDRQQPDQHCPIIGLDQMHALIRGQMIDRRAQHVGRVKSIGLRSVQRQRSPGFASTLSVRVGAELSVGDCGMGCHVHGLRLADKD
jgi:hypothetical protein